MKTVFLLLLLSFVQPLSANTETAGYYRVWQGFKRPDFTQDAFMQAIPPFMNATVDLYGGRILNQYLVAIPPSDKPSFIPDEFALVALTDEPGYRQIRATPEGQAYSIAHWDVFDKETSKSAPLVKYYESKPSVLESNTAYSMIGYELDWTKGVNVFYIGLRKPEQSPADFLKELSVHINFTAEKLGPLGLRGYMVVANENYEAGFLNFESKEVMAQALESADGKLVHEDAGRLMNTLQWSVETEFNKVSIENNTYYRTVR
jgi:hypothetical protein